VIHFNGGIIILSVYPNPDKPEPNAASRFSFYFAQIFGLKRLRKRGFPVILYSISSKIARYITKEAGFGPDYADSARYGTEIILGALIEELYFSRPPAFGTFLPQVIVAFSCGSLLSLVSGGAHCTGYLRCLGFGLLVYLFTGKAALYLERLISPNQLAPILLFGFLYGFMCLKKNL
jgi:accessory gene regulator B